MLVNLECLYETHVKIAYHNQILGSYVLPLTTKSDTLEREELFKPERKNVNLKQYCFDYKQQSTTLKTLRKRFRCKISNLLHPLTYDFEIFL